MNSLHLMRAEYLLLFIPLGVLIWQIVTQQSDERRWGRMVDAKLLKYLLIKPHKTKKQIAAPWYLILLLATIIIALSAPSWRIKPSPFAKDDTQIALVVRVADSMLTKDITPNRLARASLKIDDLLGLREDRKTALIAYSGTAHLVLPLSSDATVIKSFVDALDPAIMPLEGDDISGAIGLAKEQLESKRGSIIIITDTLSLQSIKSIKEKGFVDGYNIIFWQMATPQLSSTSDFQRASSMLEGKFAEFKGDDSDTEAISSMINNHFQNISSDSDEYEDGGYLLLPLIFLLLVLWAREGFLAEMWRRS